MTLRGPLRAVVRLVAVVCTVGAFASSPAAAFWSGSGEWMTGAGTGLATSVARGATPVVSSRGSANVSVRWGEVQMASARAVGAYEVARYDAVTGVRQVGTGGCDGMVTTLTCLETGLPEGTWVYTVTPLVGTNWRGPESLASGVVGTGPSVLELDTDLFGVPLAGTITGTVSGFVPEEGVTYLVDGVPAAGTSPAVVDSAGGAGITLDMPAGIADGPHSVQVVGDDPVHPTTATASFLVDTTAPTAGALLSSWSPRPPST